MGTQRRSESYCAMMLMLVCVTIVARHHLIGRQPTDSTVWRKCSRNMPNKKLKATGT